MQSNYALGYEEQDELSYYLLDKTFFGVFCAVSVLGWHAVIWLVYCVVGCVVDALLLLVGRWCACFLIPHSWRLRFHLLWEQAALL